jgi:hypothetical protein
LLPTFSILLPKVVILAQIREMTQKRGFSGFY